MQSGFRGRALYSALSGSQKSPRGRWRRRWRGCRGRWSSMGRAASRTLKWGLVSCDIKLPVKCIQNRGSSSVKHDLQNTMSLVEPPPEACPGTGTEESGKVLLSANSQGIIHNSCRLPPVQAVQTSPSVPQLVLLLPTPMSTSLPGTWTQSRTLCSSSLEKYSTSLHV